MSHWEFPGSEPLDTFIDIASGHVAVVAEPTSISTVELTGLGRGDRLTTDVQVNFEDGRLEVIGPRRSGLWRGLAGLAVTITVPPGSRCMVRTASADVSCTGDLSDLDAHTASGDIVAAAVRGSAAAQTASGDVRLDGAGTDAEVRTAGGDIRVARTGRDVRIRTASGDVHVGSAGGSVTVQTSSGDVRVGCVSAGQTEVTTVSGDATVGVAAGAGVYLDLSSLTGSVTSHLDEAAASDEIALAVKCRAVSGDIQIIRAAPAESDRHRSVSDIPAVTTPETPPPAS
jgi:hypothetical protein